MTARNAFAGLAEEPTLQAVLVELREKLEPGGAIDLSTAARTYLTGLNTSTTGLISSILGRVDDGTNVGTMMSLLKDILTKLDVIRADGATVSISSESVNLNTDQVEGLLTQIRDWLQASAAREATLDLVAKDATLRDLFRRTLKYEPMIGEEIRREEGDTDDYHGIAPDGSLETDTVWTVVRFYKTATGMRTRCRTGIAWSERTVGW